MSSCERIRVFEPLRAVRLLEHGAPAVSTERVEALAREQYERGYADASSHVARQIVEQRNEVNYLRETLFQALEASVARAVAEVREALPVLTMQALRRVLPRVQVDAAILSGIIEELLGEVGRDAGEVELRLHPADLALVQGMEPQLTRVHPGLRLTPDDSLGRGDCQAATKFGKVDARLGSKLENLEASLAGPG